VNPTAPTSRTTLLAATSAPFSSSVCTTVRCPRLQELCKLVTPTWRAGVRSAAVPQRQERPGQAAMPSCTGHSALWSCPITHTSCRWSDGRPPMHLPRQCMRRLP
jgi:hypothetical protein